MVSQFARPVNGGKLAAMKTILHTSGRLAALALIFSAGLAACDKQEAAPTEEEFMASMFSMVNSAAAYDQVCQQSRALNTTGTNLQSNIELVAARALQTARNNNPRMNMDTLQKSVKTKADFTNLRAAETLKKDGCETPQAKAYAETLQILIQTPPQKFNADMDTKMQSLGVKVAPAPAAGTP